MSGATRPIGFSTGALAAGDFRRALGMVSGSDLSAVELSALRDHELGPLIRSIPYLDLGGFEYRSIHAPSKLVGLTEADLVTTLGVGASWGFTVIAHPNIITQPELWAVLGPKLLIENMDKRKPGRTVEELRPLFEILPEAGWCLDVAHAHQIDTTMGVARELIKAFGDRLRQIHISEIDNAGRHHALSVVTIWAVQSISKLLPERCPAIIESIVPASGIPKEVEAVKRSFGDSELPQYGDWGALA